MRFLLILIIVVFFGLLVRITIPVLRADLDQQSKARRTFFIRFVGLFALFVPVLILNAATDGGRSLDGGPSRDGGSGDEKVANEDLPFEDRSYPNPKAPEWDFSAQGKAADLCERATFGPESDDGDLTELGATYEFHSEHLGKNQWNVEVGYRGGNGWLLHARCAVDLNNFTANGHRI